MLIVFALSDSSSAISVTVFPEAIRDMTSYSRSESVSCGVRVRSPDDIASEDWDLYRPGGRVCPPRFPATVIGAVDRPAASLYAMVKEACACCATESPACIVPITCPGGSPGTQVPAQTPRTPLIMLGPVLVTAAPARIANFAVVAGAVGGTVGQRVGKLVVSFFVSFYNNCNNVGI